MALQEAAKLLDQFKAAFNKNDLTAAESYLSQLKLKLIQLPALPPVFEQTPTAQQELTLARDVLEHAALLSLKARDDAAMERSFTQLKTFYSDTKDLLPPSPQALAMTGLDLLRLLVQNRIAEFHTELELIPPEAQSDPAVRQSIQLEQWLMEGAYNKVLGASTAGLPSEYHTALMAQLASTVRDEIASCSEKAYQRLRLADAQKMMMFDTPQAVAEYAAAHGWQVQGDYILFQQHDAAGAKEVPSMSLINNTLLYAKELERIV